MLFKTVIALSTGASIVSPTMVAALGASATAAALLKRGD
jgi:hypothetical protein